MAANPTFTALNRPIAVPSRVIRQFLSRHRIGKAEAPVHDRPSRRPGARAEVVFRAFAPVTAEKVMARIGVA
jgi:hypothetical protein